VLFRGKSIHEIDENDLLGLIGTSNEDQAVDFKKFAYPPPPNSELPSNQSERDKAKNKWKLDLCTDLSAFANAHGGWIICGMKEKDGTATELCGVGASVNAEKEIARLEQCAMSGIEPALPRLEFGSVALDDAEKSRAIVIHVPRSFRAPHRVRETSKFHVRRSGRNDEMNIDELRAAFNLSETLIDRVKSFRNERIGALAEDRQEDIPVLLNPGMRIVLHVVPIAFSEPAHSLDLSALYPRSSAMWVHEKHMASGRFTLHGYVKPRGSERLSSTRGYVQIFRNGIVECVEVIQLSQPPQDVPTSLGSLEDIVLDNLDTALHAQKNLGVQLPSVIMLSLLGTKNCVFISGRDISFERSDHPPMPLNNNRILIPDALIEEYISDHKTVMKPIFDILWNTAGWERSMSYDENGNWVRR
jgi:hypothetical protein